MHKSYSFSLCYLLLTLLLSGCSSTQFGDLFSGYTEQMQGVKRAQQQGDFTQAKKSLPLRDASDASYNLNMLELARLQFLSEEFSLSQKNFDHAYQEVIQEQQKAKIQLSKGVENVAAIVSNDNATRYSVPSYEQSMLHSYQALNYLYQQDLSGALVEVRRANLVQENALKANQNNIYKSQENLAQQGVSMKSLSGRYPSMDNTIGQVKNGFQNAYTFYLSALLYEAAGESNSAYIDYKKALEIYPDNHFLQQDTTRLATKLNMTDDLASFGYKQKTPIVTSDMGQLVIMIEHGIVASKQDFSLNLPIFTSHNDMRFYSFSLPTYQNNLQHYSPVTLTYQGKSFNSEEIVRLQSLASKQLKDQLPVIITRQVARVIAKEEIRKQMSKQGGDVGNILASLYNITTEKADTRSWSTLPDSIHILRINLASGEHQLQLNVNGKIKNIEVKINAKRNTLVNLTAIDQYTKHHTVNL